MAVPVNKEELQNAIKINYNKLKEELLSIPHELTTAPNLEGHMKNTTMSINNLISYLNGWGELVLKWNTKKERNEIVDFPETGYKWNELGKLAQKFYNNYEKDDFNTLCTELDEITGRILFLIEQKTNTELYETAWYEKWTLGRMIQFNTSSPYNNARARIRKWKKENNIK
ncbi:ClbS/DfsB family four-helix bundle protein [Flavobacterium plurextorum]|uniref:ClbS/DfsB family four-helix bundle protein n=1 Tax=Flavobacterium plurextorum TaxID=1114867 RepID=UPI0037567DB2